MKLEGKELCSDLSTNKGDSGPEPVHSTNHMSIETWSVALTINMLLLNGKEMTEALSHRHIFSAVQFSDYTSTPFSFFAGRFIRFLKNSH